MSEINTKAKQGRGGAGRGQGRKPKLPPAPNGEERKTFALYCSQSEFDYLMKELEILRDKQRFNAEEAMIV